MAYSSLSRTPPSDPPSRFHEDMQMGSWAPVPWKNNSERYAEKKTFDPEDTHQDL